MKEVVIIGGGIGGLISGALLAKEGYKVTVLEKNAIVGGGLQTFKRHGASFATGIHVIGGFQPGGNQRKLFSYLGIMDKLSLRPTDEDAFDVITVGSDKTTYRLPQGKKNYIEYLGQLFPEDKEGIKAYVEKLFELTEEQNLFYLRETERGVFPKLSIDSVRPYDELMDKYISNPKLKGMLDYLSALYGGVPGSTPAYLCALLNVIHIEGSCQFAGGNQQVVTLLTELIEEGGGSVLANEEVVKIKVENQLVTEVLTKKGHAFQADNYISAIHPAVLLSIVEGHAFPNAFKNRLHEVPETYSCFMVFLKLKENSFPYLNHANYYLDDYGVNYESGHIKVEEWPRWIMYMTPPTKDQGEFAQTMVIMSVMDFDWVKQWENTKTRHRGPEYEAWKEAMTEKMLDRMEKMYPNLRDCIEFKFASSPLTIRDYFGNKEGSLYGFQHESDNLYRSQLSVNTRVKNLFLTGQNVNIHGFCGVSLTALETVEALVGHNVILRKINKKNNI